VARGRATEPTPRRGRAKVQGAMEGPKGRGWPPATTRLDWQTALASLTLFPLAPAASDDLAALALHEEMEMNGHGTLLNGGEGSLLSTNVAISRSELVASMMRQARLAQASGNPRRAIQTGLQHLERHGLINGGERLSLSRMCDLALIAGAGGKGQLTAVEQLRQLHDAMVVKTSGPLAVAVASAILQYSTSTEAGATSQGPSQATIARLGQNPAAGFLGAVIIGGAIGGALGGVPGALIGVVGGAIGGLTACSGD
jgi:hypothetical protein